MPLRDYQAIAVDRIWQHTRAKKQSNPCVVLPTGSGKTHVIAQLCQDAVGLWGGRVLILAHVKELLQQAYDKLHAADPGLDIGIYSAGLGLKQPGSDVVIAGIQSVWKKAEELGRRDICIVDEAHLIPTGEGEGRYRALIKDLLATCPHMRVIGLTATPYRTKTGLICAPENMLNEVVYEVGVKELIHDGFLSPLRSKHAKAQAKLGRVSMRMGDYHRKELETALTDEGLMQSMVSEALTLAKGRKHILIFTSGLLHAEKVTDLLRAAGETPGLVTGKTPKKQRASSIEDFRAGGLRILTSVSALTTGLDAPKTDCCILMRPTKSPGLYYQMVGRGFRISPGKKDCLILDFGGCIERFGPVDLIVPRKQRQGEAKEPGVGDLVPEKPVHKVCPDCATCNPRGAQFCAECGYQFTELTEQASERAIISVAEREELHVVRTLYAVHAKKGAAPGHPRTLRVDYCSYGARASEWICVEHEGRAHRKALRWWASRSRAPMPATAEMAASLANRGALARTTLVETLKQPGEQWPRIVAYEIDDVPEYSLTAEDHIENAVLEGKLDLAFELCDEAGLDPAIFLTGAQLDAVLPF